MRKNWLISFLKCLVGIIVLAYVMVRHWEPEGEDGVGLKSALIRANRWEFFAVSAVCLSLCTALTFVRWFWLVRAQDLPFTLRDAFRLGLVGYFFNTLLPGSVGGDLLKAAFLAREQRRRTVAISTILIDRGVGLWGLIALTAAVGGFLRLRGDPSVTEQGDLSRVVQAALTLMALTGALWLFLGILPERRAQRFRQRLLWIPKLGSVLAEFWLAVWLYRKRGHAVLGGLAMSILGHVLTVFAFFFAALSFQARDVPPQMPSLVDHFIIVPAGMAFQGFFPSPGGIGGGEFIFGLLYSRLGVPAPHGIWGSFGYRMNTWLLGFLGYLVYLTMKRDLQRAVARVSGETSMNSTLPEVASNTTQL